MRTGIVTVSGREYQFCSASCLGVRGRFESWMKQQAYSEMEEFCALLVTPEGKPDRKRIAEQWAEFRRDVTSHLYTWGTTVCNRFLSSDKGTQALFGFMFELADPCYDRTLPERIYSLPEKERDAVMETLFSLSADPLPAPATTPPAPVQTKG
jgi:hypothetical protein